MSLLLCLLFCGEPITAEAGEVVVIQSKNAAQWGIYPPSKSYFTLEGGKTFVAGAGKYAGKFVVYRSDVDLGDKLDVTVVTVTDDGVSPNPPDPDTPDPIVPDPVAPLSELSKKVKQWLADVEDPDLTNHKTELASNFMAIRSAIAAGTLKTKSEIQAETSALNRDTLGEAIQGWNQWLTKLALELQAMELAGGLSTPEQISKVWEQIAKGLE